MKKSLVLAMAMALGVTASAYAANPFSDVPAGHWAYDSISKLAAAGVIEGYGDDTFRGDRLMTRYEMAQIVAKAMAKGANVDKLAAEFADELDALGVRVAALEKKSDNVRITGKIRYRWGIGSADPNSAEPGTKQKYNRLRSDITINGKINDGWNYVAMLRNEQIFNNDIGDENTAFQRAYVQGRLGGLRIQAGRYNATLFHEGGDPYDHRVDAVRAEYGDKFKVAGWYGKPTATNGTGYSVFAGASLSYDWDNFGVWAEYNKFGAKHRAATYDPVGNQTNGTRDIWGIGANGKFGDFGLAAQFLHGKFKNNAGKKNGWSVEATYKGADKSKVNSWGLGVKYYDMGNFTYLPGCKTYDAFDAFNQPEGYKGIRVSADYTVAKNMVAGVQYYDLKGKGAGATKEKTFLAQMMFYF